MAGSDPPPNRSRWLRKLSLHLWSILEFNLAGMMSSIRLQKTNSRDARQQIYSELANRLIQVADALDCGPPPPQLSRYHAIGFWNRAKRLLAIVGFLLVLPREMRPALSELQSLRLIHFSELALDYMLASVDKALGSGWRAESRHRCHRRKLKFRVTAYQSLSSAYVELELGDKAIYLEHARRCCDAAAQLLEGESDQYLALMAATAEIGVAHTLLYYPTEDSVTYAKPAVAMLSQARNLLKPLAASAQLASPAFLDTDKWRQLTISERRRQAWRLAVGKRKLAHSGIVDSSIASTKVLPLLARADWSLGIGFHRLGMLKEAIEHFDLALKDFPEIADVRAAILVDKGRAYLETTNGDRSQNLTRAMECFRQVTDSAQKLRLRSYVVFAALGNAHAQLDLDDLGFQVSIGREKVLSNLIPALRNGVLAARSMGMTQAVQEGLSLLGRAYQALGEFPRAYRALALAVRVNGRLQRGARTLRLKNYWVGFGAPLHDHLVDQALRYADSDLAKLQGCKLKLHFVRQRMARCLALSTAEHGRTVLLREELSNRSLLPKGAGTEDVSELFRLRRSLHAAELSVLHREWAPDAEMPGENNDTAALRQHRAEAEDEYLKELEVVRTRFNNPIYDPDRPISSASYAELRGMVTRLSKDQNTALVEYYVTDRNVRIFVLLPKRRENRLRLLNFTSSLSPDRLVELGTFWIDGLARRTHPVQLERGYLPQILEGLRDLAARPAEAIAMWEKENSQRLERVVIVPHRFLHLLPLHAVALPNGERWCDIVGIQYSPSATVLFKLLQSRPSAPVDAPPDGGKKFMPGKAICISYSDQSEGVPLAFEGQEARAVADETDAELLAGNYATPSRVKAALQRATYAHFVCHGVFDKEFPLETHLRLAPEEDSGRCPGPARPYAPLTLGEIFEGVHLPHTRLVVLSSCETGLARVENLHEEYIGFPTGFLYAGAQAVVSALWPVSDLATWLLMRRFVKEIASEIAPTPALRSAQRALRGLSRDSIIREVSAAARAESDPDKRQRMVNEGEHLFGEFPFSNPYWWAGFVVHGLG